MGIEKSPSFVKPFVRPKIPSFLVKVLRSSAAFVREKVLRSFTGSSFVRSAFVDSLRSCAGPSFARLFVRPKSPSQAPSFVHPLFFQTRITLTHSLMCTVAKHRAFSAASFLSAAHTTMLSCLFTIFGSPYPNTATSTTHASSFTLSSPFVPSYINHTSIIKIHSIIYNYIYNYHV